MNSQVIFLQEFLKHPRQVVSVIPSSRFLERRIVELAETRSAQTVVELGAGVGGTTRAILRAMSPEARLLSIEINRQFCALLRQNACEPTRSSTIYSCKQEVSHGFDHINPTRTGHQGTRFFPA